ncbi:chorismate--pyruvate lyase family protein [Methylobacter psychrophilus]|uniref:chorismate--pyruvate lyase family protein n=1 Tax=Methylobacter psychrophilus TaxID=96941 RepID=UPI0021D4BAD1|nr:chorismate lyase [Methylobacter psychrophilus]
MTTKSLLFNREPSWQENCQGLRHKIPENIQSWTYESGSLTQRLRNYYGAGVAVKVLLQRWQTPFLSERRLLKLPEHQYSLIREVLLHVNGKPLILARTIIPASTVKTAKSNLSKLGSRPLGEIIFSYPKLERIAMDITLINPSTWTQSALTEVDIKQPIWGRRTVYAIAHQQMLVSEFFLPEILK